ncbi:hypothetical protein [Armatimonas sp.]|uniref:hypothetical protein n=1 Tax=Armatimonas sp. TaxID=1872638 RepID=UPI00286BF1B3|nr:hypothetical protein [Armatimonas sp.]
MAGLKVEVQSHPTGLLFTGKVAKSLFACVCGACGFTELYAEDPQELYHAFQVAQGISGGER